MTTHLPVGFAEATLPVSAATITTDTEGLDASETKVRSGDFEMPAYEARPIGNGPFPVVLVIQEVFGVHEHIKDICRRLAKEGYLAIAPELYARKGDPSKISDIQELIEKIVSKVPDEQVMQDLDATVQHIGRSGKGDVERLGITGFCWGGRIVWLYAARQPQLKAGAAWYGPLVAGPWKGDSERKQPIDVAAELMAPVIGFYGGKDPGIPVSTVEQMELALENAGKENCELVIYPEAGHAFNADYRPSYHEASALDAWAKMLAWFETYGVV